MNQISCPCMPLQVSGSEKKINQILMYISCLNYVKNHRCHVHLFETNSTVYNRYLPPQPPPLCRHKVLVVKRKKQNKSIYWSELMRTKWVCAKLATIRTSWNIDTGNIRIWDAQCQAHRSQLSISTLFLSLSLSISFSLSIRYK